MIAIIDYNAGNVASVRNALARIGVDCVITKNPAEVLAADGVIFPGQGRAGMAMAELRSSGLDAVLPKITRPFLGICLGMQLLCDSSQEDNATGLSIISGVCRKFPKTLKTPHIGWNTVSMQKPSPLTAGLADNTYFYFVHSYYADADKACVVAETPYGFLFPSIVQKNNFYGVQFHPEKSGDAGRQLLANFCSLCT